VRQKRFPFFRTGKEMRERVNKPTKKLRLLGVAFLKDGHRVSAGRSLVPPKIAKPLGRKLAISNRMLDVLVAEIVLQ
jgi:hypothetical protein